MFPRYIYVNEPGKLRFAVKIMMVRHRFWPFQCRFKSSKISGQICAPLFNTTDTGVTDAAPRLRQCEHIR